MTSLTQMLQSLHPALHPDCWVYASPLGEGWQQLPLLGCFRETEGWTLILREQDARAAGLTIHFQAAWLTLTVASELAAVGLTAAVARALAQAGIACNVVAALHHDHLFVPWADGPAALACLQALQRDSTRHRSSAAG